MGIKQNVFYRLENGTVHQLEVPHKIYLCLCGYTSLVPLSIYPSVNIRRRNFTMDFFFQTERNWNTGVRNIKGKIYDFKFEDKTDPLPPAQREFPSMNTSFVNKKKESSCKARISVCTTAREEWRTLANQGTASCSKNNPHSLLKYRGFFGSRNEALLPPSLIN